MLSRRNFTNWKHDYKFEGKRVGIIGTGASSIQIIPHVADLPKKMTIFQRTAPWISPRQNNEISNEGKERFKKYPLYKMDMAMDHVYNKKITF